MTTTTTRKATGTRTTAKKKATLDKLTQSSYTPSNNGSAVLSLMAQHSGGNSMFGTIEQAEQAIEQLAQTIGDQKLGVIKIVAEIRHDELWRKATNPQTQKAFGGFDAWLQDRAEWLNKYAGMGPRQVQRHLKAYLCFVDALDMPEDLLQRAGEHALILATVANTAKDLNLREDDIPNKTGGKYLGKETLKQHFNELMNQIDNNPAWKIKNTTQMVADIKGKVENAKADWSIDATLDDTDPTERMVHVSAINYIYDGQMVEAMIPAPMPYDLFKQFVKSTNAAVTGGWFNKTDKKSSKKK